MITEKERVFNILQEQPQFDRNRHGSLWDRGSADSYYNRPQQPHWYPNGTGVNPMITDLNDQERAEYVAGYEYNEQHGGKKNWE
jgi:hypothetical protein